jgi:hypothetical protein
MKSNVSPGMRYSESIFVLGLVGASDGMRGCFGRSGVVCAGRRHCLVLVVDKNVPLCLSTEGVEGFWANLIVICVEFGGRIDAAKIKMIWT